MANENSPQPVSPLPTMFPSSSIRAYLPHAKRGVSLLLLASALYMVAACSGESAPPIVSMNEPSGAAAQPLVDEGTASAAGEKPGAAADWPVFRGDAQASGVARCVLPEKLEVLWRFTLERGAFESTAAIARGVVIIGDREGVIYALNLADGSKRWEVKTKSSFLAAAAVREGRVYLGDMDGKMHVLDAATGQPLWSKELESEIDGGANFYQNLVLVGCQNATLYALNAATGEVAWKFAIDDQIRCSPTIAGNRCFLAGCDSKLHCIDLDHGKSVAKVPLQSPTGVTPSVRDDRVFVGTQGGVFFAIDWRKAEVAWSFAAEDSSVPYDGSPAVQGEIVVTPQGKQMHGLQAQTGKLLWSISVRGKIESSPVIAGQRVLFGSHDGRLYTLDLATGKEIDALELGGKLIGSPAVADGRLVIASDRGVVYCLGKKD